MKRYIALLRGINISGKNKLPMEELRKGVSSLGYADVRSYLNSGNLLFSTAGTDEAVLAADIRAMIAERFGLDIPVYILAQEKLAQLLAQALDRWDTPDKTLYDNLIFVLPTAAAENIAAMIGEATPGLERIQLCGDVIFRGFDLARHSKANRWKKTASAGIGEHLTIRTANTLKKLLTL